MNVFVDTLFVGGPLHGTRKEIEHCNEFVADDGTRYKLRAYYKVKKKGADYLKGVLVAEGMPDEEVIRFLQEGGHT